MGHVAVCFHAHVTHLEDLRVKVRVGLWAISVSTSLAPAQRLVQDRDPCGSGRHLPGTLVLRLPGMPALGRVLLPMPPGTKAFSLLCHQNRVKQSLRAVREQLLPLTGCKSVRVSRGQVPAGA